MKSARGVEEHEAVIAAGVLALAGRRRSWPEAATRRLAAYLELAKPRITALVLLAAIVGFWLGSRGTPDGLRLLRAVGGIALLAAGMFALNQYVERDLDALMRRTGSRPLPAGRLRPAEALWFGGVLSALAVGLLGATVNLLAGALALATLASYTGLYTPLKTRTPHCTLVGAFPGAMPPVVGWAAARGEIGMEAWVLFGILFLWQFPHFHSIAWLYRDDYARAGIRLWPVVRPENRTIDGQIAAFTVLLLPVSLLPSLLGLAGKFYLSVAVVSGMAFALPAIAMALRRSDRQAQRLLLASVLYLPVLLLVMVLDKV